MINWIEKGQGLIDALNAAGFRKATEENAVNVYPVEREAEAQAIIYNYDPLPLAKTEAKAKVKEVSAAKRLQYVTQAAGKDAEYKTKEAEAAQYAINGTVGVFMQARMDKTGESAATVGAEWSAKAVKWQAIGAEIAAIEDKAGMDIDDCEDWLLCKSIAKSAIASFDLI
jgi:hypothetical protein